MVARADAVRDFHGQFASLRIILSNAARQHQHHDVAQQQRHGRPIVQVLRSCGSPRSARSPWRWRADTAGHRPGCWWRTTRGCRAAGRTRPPSRRCRMRVLRSRNPSATPISAWSAVEEDGRADDGGNHTRVHDRDMPLSPKAAWPAKKAMTTATSSTTNVTAPSTGSDLGQQHRPAARHGGLRSPDGAGRIFRT